MLRSLSLSWNFLPVSISSSMSTATNTALPLSSPASLSQVGSSFAHGLHQSAPTVTTTHLPLNDLSLSGLPLPSVAMSSSARRSPTLSTSARAGVARATRNSREGAGGRGRRRGGGGGGAPPRPGGRERQRAWRWDASSRSSIHGEVFVDPH